MMERQTSGPMQKSPSKSVGRKDEYTCEEVDSLSEQFEQIARRQMLSQGQVKLRATERDLLAVAENIRDKLKVAVSGEKGQLAEVFGGDCRRFHRIRCVLDEVKLSDMHASDRRWPDVAVQMDIIEQVLKELGLYKPWVPKKKAPECLRYLGVRSRITPGDKVFLRPEFEACEDVVFTVEPPLPAGLELDPSNGRITGELDAELAVGLQTYVVTARNEGGEASFELAFAVAPPAPGTIAYPVMAAEQLFVGEVVRIVPERGGGHPKEWSVDPELPEGLIISPGTGEITGVPVALAPVAAYLVTAANAGGKVSVPLQLGVAHAPPLCLSYPDLQERRGQRQAWAVRSRAGLAGCVPAGPERAFEALTSTCRQATGSLRGFLFGAVLVFFVADFGCGNADGDFYPHMLAVVPLAGMVAFSTTGQPINGSLECRRFSPGQHELRGENWEPTPPDYAQAFSVDGKP
ncbi:unnamed protein product [Prorocentrum cordatum]|uniref:Uncharacterized protein n=1 Tax=Prorocentrum cordatum TaxID=2364126 RepID=A0ABN9Y656_9DINO|nr:unnamed protein product [Polarella glacialis]